MESSCAGPCEAKLSMRSLTFAEKKHVEVRVEQHEANRAGEIVGSMWRLLAQFNGR